MLILTRKENQVLQFSDHIYVEFGKRSKEGTIKCTLYNRKTDEEYTNHLCIDNPIYLKVNNTDVSVQLLHFKSSRIYNVGIEAPKEIDVSRVGYIKYLTYVEALSLGLDDDDEYWEDDDVEMETPKYSHSEDDELINKYKGELSWFFN